MVTRFAVSNDKRVFGRVAHVAARDRVDAAEQDVPLRGDAGDGDGSGLLLFAGHWSCAFLVAVGLFGGRHPLGIGLDRHRPWPRLPRLTGARAGREDGGGSHAPGGSSLSHAGSGSSPSHASPAPGGGVASLGFIWSAAGTPSAFRVDIDAP